MIITSKQLAELEALGFEGDVLKLEDYVMLLQDAAADGEPPAGSSADTYP